MKRNLILAMMLILTACFQNCGGATFETTSLDSGAGIGDGEAPGDDISNNPSPERIPLREIENDPTLLDRFACPTDSSSVEICHFPQGSGSYHTQCVGRPAVDTHYDHYYPETDDYDYLGACKP